MKLGRIVCAAMLMALAMVFCTAAASAAYLGVGTVDEDGLRLRAEAGVGGEVLATATAGDFVLILEDEEESAVEGWYRVDYQTTVGFMSAEYVTVSQTTAVDLGHGVVDTDGTPLNLRTGPGTDHSRIASIPSWSVVKLDGFEDGWFRITYGNRQGYVSGEYILASDAYGKRADTAAPDGSAPGDELVRQAMTHLGKPYVYGGKGPNSFDCSGFTLYVYQQFGISIPAGATQQYLRTGTKLENRFDARPGDLVFINDPRRNGGKPVSHVGIYIGNGKFIHASTNSYTVRVDDLFTGHYAQYYIAAKRV